MKMNYYGAYGQGLGRLSTTQAHVHVIWPGSLSIGRVFRRLIPIPGSKQVYAAIMEWQLL